MNDAPLHDKHQLDLGLPDSVLGNPGPWGGVSPRVLTSAYRRFSLKAQAVKSVSDFVDPEQYDLWLPIQERPFIYDGAPLLLPLKGV